MSGLQILYQFLYTCIDVYRLQCSWLWINISEFDMHMMQGSDAEWNYYVLLVQERGFEKCWGIPQVLSFCCLP